MEKIHKDEKYTYKSESINLNNEKKYPKIYEYHYLEDEKETIKLNSDSELESKIKFYNAKEKKIEKYSNLEIILSLVFIILLMIFAIKYILPEEQPEESSFIKRPNKIQNKEVKNKNDKSNKKIGQKKNEIDICQEGFFVPKGHTRCYKCFIANCSRCNGHFYKQKCLSCMNSFVPVFEKNNIKKCFKPCETGENEKCATCFEDKCGSCHKGYNLANGSCILNHSIRGLYNTSHANENILLINENYTKYINEIIIDGLLQKRISNNFTFSNSGLHTVIMLLNTSNLYSGRRMFFNITQLFEINFTRLFNTEKMINMKEMFKDCKNLNSIGLSGFKTGKVADFSYMFDNCFSLSNINISNLNTKSAKTIKNMFSNCKSLKSISLKNFNTIQTIDMGRLFSGCSSLSSIDISSFKTQNAKFMSYMFSGCFSLSYLDISSFKTEKVNEINYMFKDCSNLKYIDLKNFNSNNITNMEGTFMGCAKLTSIDLSNFNSSSLQNVDKIFFGCNELKNIDISNFKITSWNKENKLFDSKIGKNGKIFLGRKFYKKIKKNIPIGWEVVKTNSNLKNNKN